MNIEAECLGGPLDGEVHALPPHNGGRLLVADWPKVPWSLASLDPVALSPVTKVYTAKEMAFSVWRSAHSCGQVVELWRWFVLVYEDATQNLLDQYLQQADRKRRLYEYGNEIEINGKVRKETVLTKDGETVKELPAYGTEAYRWWERGAHDEHEAIYGGLDKDAMEAIDCIRVLCAVDGRSVGDALVSTLSITGVPTNGWRQRRRVLKKVRKALR